MLPVRPSAETLPERSLVHLRMWQLPRSGPQRRNHDSQPLTPAGTRLSGVKLAVGRVGLRSCRPSGRAECHIAHYPRGSVARRWCRPSGRAECHIAHYPRGSVARRRWPRTSGGRSLTGGQSPKPPRQRGLPRTPWRDGTGPCGRRGDGRLPEQATGSSPLADRHCGGSVPGNPAGYSAHSPDWRSLVSRPGRP